MQIGNLVKSNTQAYTHSAYARQTDASEGNDSPKKVVDAGTLHIGGALAAAKIVSDYDIENISPRDFAELSNKLFQKGIISQEENSVLSFQPELHPDYNDTIGKKTGTIAAPDDQRDYLQIWKEKVQLHEEMGNSREAVSSRQILTILENLNAFSIQ